jgi:hypothetical protein
MTPDPSLEVGAAIAPVQKPAGTVKVGWVQSRRTRFWALLGIVAMATSLPVALAIFTGSIAIPHNDAWSHSKIAEEFGRTGLIRLVGWNRTALVGQVVPLGPLGTSILAQHVFVAALSVVGLAATYAYLVRRVVPLAALLGTLVVGIIPEFGLLSTSFMSDIPAFAALMVCLVLVDQALATKKPRYLALALLAGVWGVTIREQDLVGPVVGVAVTAVAWRGHKRLLALGLGSMAAAAIGIFELWRRSLPYGDSPIFQPDVPTAWLELIQAVFTLALYVAPAVFTVARPRQWRIGTRWLSAIALIPTVALAAAYYPTVFLGNYLDPSGAYYGASVGIRTHVIPSWLWLGLVALACMSICLSIGVLLDRRDRIDQVSALLGTLLIVGTIAQVTVGQIIFARYLLPLLPIACVVILNDRRPRNWWWGIPSIACLAVVSMAITANALSFDAARWRAASTLQQQGIPAVDIDAGLEWVGYHAAEPAVRRPGHRGTSGWYMRMFEKSRECYVVSASPLKGLRLLRTSEYRSYGVFGTSQLWLYQRDPCR